MPIDATNLLTRNVVMLPGTVDLAVSNLGPSARNEQFGAVLERQVSRERPREKNVAPERKPAERPKAAVAKRERREDRVAEESVARETERLGDGENPAHANGTDKADETEKANDSHGAEHEASAQGDAETAAHGQSDSSGPNPANAQESAAALAAMPTNEQRQQADELALASKVLGRKGPSTRDAWAARAELKEATQDESVDPEGPELQVDRDKADGDAGNKNIGLVTKEIANSLPLHTEEQDLKQSKADLSPSAKKAAQRGDATTAQQVDGESSEAQLSDADPNVDSTELNERVQLSNMTRVRGSAQHNVEGMARHNSVERAAKLDLGSSSREELDQQIREMTRSRRQQAVAQAVNRMTLRNGASGEIDVPELGRVSIAARTIQGEVEVKVRAQEASTLAVLQSVSAEMERELRANSVDLRDLDIDEEDEDTPDRPAEEDDDESPGDQEEGSQFNEPGGRRRVRTLL